MFACGSNSDGQLGVGSLAGMPFTGMCMLCVTRMHTSKAHVYMQTKGGGARKREGESEGVRAREGKSESERGGREGRRGGERERERKLRKRGAVVRGRGGGEGGLEGEVVVEGCDLQ